MQKASSDYITSMKQYLAALRSNDANSISFAEQKRNDAGAKWNTMVNGADLSIPEVAQAIKDTDAAVAAMTKTATSIRNTSAIKDLQGAAADYIKYTKQFFEQVEKGHTAEAATASVEMENAKKRYDGLKASIVGTSAEVKKIADETEGSIRRLTLDNQDKLLGQDAAAVSKAADAYVEAHRKYISVVTSDNQSGASALKTASDSAKAFFETMADAAGKSYPQIAEIIDKTNKKIEELDLKQESAKNKEDIDKLAEAAAKYVEKYKNYIAKIKGGDEGQINDALNNALTAKFDFDNLAANADTNFGRVRKIIESTTESVKVLTGAAHEAAEKLKVTQANTMISSIKKDVTEYRKLNSDLTAAQKSGDDGRISSARQEVEIAKQA